MASDRSGRYLRFKARSVVIALLAFTTAIPAVAPAPASASVSAANNAQSKSAVSGEAAGSLESVASKAGDTGRKVAMSLIGLAFAVAGVVTAFRRDFKEAVGVLAVGLVAVLLATPAGLTLLRDTVNTLLGS